ARAGGQLQREASQVGEAVERLAVRVGTRADVVVPLVQEGAGLLAPDEVQLELHQALGVGNRLGHLAVQHALHLLQTFVGPHAHIRAVDDALRLEVVHQQAHEHRREGVGGGDEELHAQVVAVTIDDEPRKPVRLRVDHPVGTLSLQHVPAQGVCHLDATPVEGFVDDLVLEGQRAQGDLGGRRVEGLAQEPPAAIDDPDHLSTFGEGGGFEIRPVDPGVPRLPALDATTGERDLRESIRTGAEGTGAVAGTVPAFPWWMALSVGTGGAMGGSGAAGRFQGKSPQTVSARTRRILHCVRYELLWQSSVPGTPYPIETVNAALEARGVAARDEGGQTWVLRTVPVEVGPVMEGGVQVATELRL